MKKLKIFNEFGFNPTTNYTAAGLDFYIPDLRREKPEECENIWKELSISYKQTVENLHNLGNSLVRTVLSISNLSEDFVFSNILNLVHLYCALDMSEYEDEYGINRKYDPEFIHDWVNEFVEYSLIIPKNEEENFGISANLNDSVFFNSGIRVALPHSYAGVFMNKSGRANMGWSIRSQVVDEDYTGLVHLSLAFTKDKYEGSYLYIGDKITQMLILPIYLVDGVENLTEQEYYKEMEGSKRGNKGFGSSDEKHL